ncbi:unnamed protein product [Protopolystoma xenopodis]|uniref:Uncharacterized protein n=1 Tax=Protopolystoma xenopodis TaxID=117903 RepID=A0A448X7L8_9PLAT|nr:unnamed protein product [Protopolystoma xenopodis]
MEPIYLVRRRSAYLLDNCLYVDVTGPINNILARLESLSFMPSCTSDMDASVCSQLACLLTTLLPTRTDVQSPGQLPVEQLILEQMVSLVCPQGRQIRILLRYFFVSYFLFYFIL